MTNTAPRRLPAVATLDGFTATVSAAEGVTLSECEPMSALLIRTCNTQYRLVLTTPGGSILVQGGAFFPELTAGRLEGSSCGGSLLRIGFIGIGLRMEIFANGQRIVTSPVRTITPEAVHTSTRTH